MSSQRSRRQNKRARSEQRRFKVRGIRRDQVDMGKLSKALLGLAEAEAERQAQAEHAAEAPEASKPAVPDASAEPGTPDRRRP